MQDDKSKLPRDTLIERRKGISIIWLVPLIAALIGAWLLYKGIKEAPTNIVIQFESAAGISEDKTQVILQGVNIGKVTALHINETAKAVDVHIAIKPEAAKFLTTDAKFWLVKPEVSMAGIRGLDTIFSGNYIAFTPGTGKTIQHKFKALGYPPILSKEKKGRHVTLSSKSLDSIDTGSPIYYKKIKVGQIVNYKLVDDGSNVEIRAFIEPQYSHLLKKESRFWNTSGIRISGDLSGFEVNVGSLLSIIDGGIAFYTPESITSPKESENWDAYELFPNFDKAEIGVNILLGFSSGHDIVENQTKVIYDGFTVGVVRDIKAMQDLKGVWATVAIEPNADIALVEGTRFWIVKPQIELGGISGIDAFFKGNYIEMDVGGVTNRAELERKKPAREFMVLPDRPAKSLNDKGLTLFLNAERLGSITKGSAVTYRQLPVGTVEEYKLSKDNKTTEINIHIKEAYQHLVRTNSKFWNSSGLSISGGLSGLKIHTESLSALISGGLAFDTPASSQARQVKDGDRFTLYDSEEQTHDRGPAITIHLNNGNGLKVGTEIKYHGVQIGKVIRIELDTDLQGVVVHAQLATFAKSLARETTRFWVVKPEIGLAKTENLGTLISGFYIQALPAKEPGKIATEFIGLNKPPTSKPVKSGLNLTLSSGNKGSTKVGTPVYYREIPVGKVTGYELSKLSNSVNIFINIESRYSALVRQNSRFWNASGINIDVGLFSGAKIRTESMEAILSGGLAFATPDNANMGDTVQENDSFKLYPEVNPKWLEWTPEIPLQGN